MYFLFVCGWCGEEYVLWGEPVATWWTDKYRVDDETECWSCGGDNITPAPPWTPAYDD